MISNTPAKAPFPWQEEQWRRFVEQYRADRIAHAYLVCGADGLGKGRFIDAVAGLLLCESVTAAGEACGNCRSCLLLRAGNQPDLFHLVPEKGSRLLKIEQVREISAIAGMTTHTSRRKVITIKDAELFTTAAANALLKTLEEPSASTVLLLSSSRPGAMPPTLRSRCQKINFKTPDRKTAATWLSAQVPEVDICAALSAANNRPLMALAMLSNGHLEGQEILFKGLKSLWDGKSSPVELAAKLHSRDIDQTIMQLSRTLAIVIRFLVTADRSTMEEAGITDLLPFLEAGLARDDSSLLEGFCRLAELVELSARQVSGQGNPNPTLLLQALLWNWQTLAPAP